MRLLLALVLVAGLGACSAEPESPGAESTRKATPSPSAPEPGAPVQPDARDSPACAEVRAGIDAFNTGDYQETVKHFRLAQPLSRSQARTAPSQGAEDLVEAVNYYARLAPEDYPESARSSVEFAKYKAITLGQCRPVGMPVPDDLPEPPEVTA